MSQVRVPAPASGSDGIAAMSAKQQYSEVMDAYLDRAISREAQAGVHLALGLLERGVPSEVVIVDVLAAAQHEVGERWLRDEWTVADEHLVSGVTQKTLDAVSTAIEAPDNVGYVVVACAEGEWHSLPAQMLAEQLRSHGVAVAFLGASTPLEDVVKLLSRRRPDALAVSCTMPVNFAGVIRLVEAAHAHGIPVLTGGRALGSDPQRAHRLGADGWGATVTEAVSVLDAWRSRPPLLSASPTTLDHAALHLDANASTLAAAAFDGLCTEFPHMRSYSDEEVARTRHDLTYIVRFVAAASLVDCADVLTEFLAWLQMYLSHRGVSPKVLEAGLRVLAPLISGLDARGGAMLKAAIASEPLVTC